MFLQKGKYALSEPKPVTKDTYVKDLQNQMLSSTKGQASSITAYKKQPLVKRVTGKAVCTIAAKRLLKKALQVHKEHAGSLLKTVRTVQSMQISGADDFGEGCHTASTEPHFCDSAYNPVKRGFALPLDEYGRCILATKITTNDSKSAKHHSKQPRLLNKDLFQERSSVCVLLTVAKRKLMRELSAGVYNLLKQSCVNQHITIGMLLNNVQANDERLEANLCTMLQSVRGTKQYWFHRKSELRCMIREWGSSTLSHI